MEGDGAFVGGDEGELLEDFDGGVDAGGVGEARGEGCRKLVCGADEHGAGDLGGGKEAEDLEHGGDFGVGGFELAAGEFPGHGDAVGVFAGGASGLEQLGPVVFESAEVVGEGDPAGRDDGGGLLDGQGKVAEGLAEGEGGGLEGAAAAADEELDGVGAFEDAEGEGLADGGVPALVAGGDQDVSAGFGDVGLDGLGVGGVVENQEPVVAVAELIADGEARVLDVSVTGGDCAELLGKGEVEAGERVGFGGGEPPDDVVFTQVSVGVFEGELGLTDAAGTADGLDASGGGGEEGLVEGFEDALAADEVGILGLGQVVERGRGNSTIPGGLGHGQLLGATLYLTERIGRDYEIIHRKTCAGERGPHMKPEGVLGVGAVGAPPFRAYAARSY